MRLLLLGLQRGAPAEELVGALPLDAAAAEAVMEHPLRLQLLEVPVVDLTGRHLDLRATWALGIPALIALRELRSVAGTYLPRPAAARDRAALSPETHTPTARGGTGPRRPPPAAAAVRLTENIKQHLMKY